MRQNPPTSPKKPLRATTSTTLRHTLDPAAIPTLILLIVLLLAGPVVLGAARLWYELPLLGGVAVLLALQGLRLVKAGSQGSLRAIDAIDCSVLLFVVYTLIRWLTSPTEYFSRLEALNVVAYSTVFLTCRYGLARRTHALYLLGALVALGVGELAFGYYLSQNPHFFPFGPTEQLHLYYAPRWVGTYGCPDHYAGLLVMAVGAALALGAFSKLSWPVRILLFYVALMMMVGIIFTGSRGAWLALFASIIAITAFSLRYGTLRWWVPLSAAALLIATFIGVLVISPNFQSRLAEVESTFQNGTLKQYVRVQLAFDALRIAHDHPFFGTGPGTFVFIHPTYQSSTFAWKAMLTHDDYLNCLDDYGLAGFAIAMFFVAAVTLRLCRKLRADNRWQDRVLMAAPLAAWAALLVHSTVDFNLHIPGNALMFFALAGIGLRQNPSEVISLHWSTVSLAHLGRILGWIVMVFALAYGLQIARTAASDIIYEQTAIQALSQPTIQSIQGIENALAYDGGNARAWSLLGDLQRSRASRDKTMEERQIDGQKALDAYHLALKANPLDNTLQARMGLTFDVMGRYAEAFFCYKTAIGAEPYNGQFWVSLGNHYWQRGLLEKAEQAYLMAIKCPHGFEGSQEAARQVRTLLDARGIPIPLPGTNPLAPVETMERATIP